MRTPTPISNRLNVRFSTYIRISRILKKQCVTWHNNTSNFRWLSLIKNIPLNDFRSAIFCHVLSFIHYMHGGKSDISILSISWMETTHLTQVILPIIQHISEMIYVTSSKLQMFVFKKKTIQTNSKVNQSSSS